MSEAGETIEIRPNPGPQEEFLSTSADIAFYGGAAGGGKTFSVLLDGLRWHEDPEFGGVVFRREGVDLTGPGSVWEEATKLYSMFGCEFRQAPYLEARFPSGASIIFRHLQHESDRLSHQGKQYSWIAFEELDALRRVAVLVPVGPATNASARASVPASDVQPRPGQLRPQDDRLVDREGRVRDPRAVGRDPLLRAR